MAFQVSSNPDSTMQGEAHVSGSRVQKPYPSEPAGNPTNGLYFGAVLLPKACTSKAGLQIGAPSYSEFTCWSHHGPSAARGAPRYLFPLHSLPLQQQLNGESAHLGKGKPIFQSLCGLAGFQVRVICLLDARSSCQLPLLPWVQMAPNLFPLWFFSLRVALQTACTMFPNLSTASWPWSAG